MRVAFCVWGVDLATVHRTEFYSQDLLALTALGCNVDILRSPTELRPSYDIAFVWWWNYLWLWGPVARLLGVPIVTTGVFDVRATARWSPVKRYLKYWGTRFSAINVFISEVEADDVPYRLPIALESVRYSPLAIDGDVYRPLFRSHDADGAF